MRSVLSTAALASLLTSAQAAPAISSVPDPSAIVPIPNDIKALAAWASANNVGFDPKYVHVPLPNEVLNPSGVIAGIPSLLANLTSYPLNRGKIPSSPTNPLSARLNGPDDRYQYTDPTSYPFRATGRIQASNGVFCSGQLIGPRHVLTAKHCLQLDKQNISMTFSPSYDRTPNPNMGTANVINYVYNGTKFDRPECGYKHDHAILILDRRMGEGLGWFGAEVAKEGFWNQKIFTTMGYPGDRDGGRRPYRMDGSQLKNPGVKKQFECDLKTGPIVSMNAGRGIEFALTTRQYSDSDIYPGQSGSAIWKDSGVVWGVSAVLWNYPDGSAVSGWASGDDLLKMIWWSVETFK